MLYVALVFVCFVFGWFLFVVCAFFADFVLTLDWFALLIVGCFMFTFSCILFVRAGCYLTFVIYDVCVGYVALWFGCCLFFVVLNYLCINSVVICGYV